jgi:hypothetical protein
MDGSGALFCRADRERHDYAVQRFACVHAVATPSARRLAVAFALCFTAPPQLFPERAVGSALRIVLFTACSAFTRTRAVANA